MRTPRKDKQLFKELDSVQLKAVVEGLGLVISQRLMTDGLSVIDVRPVYLLREKAEAELSSRARVSGKEVLDGIEAVARALSNGKESA